MSTVDYSRIGLNRLFVISICLSCVRTSIGLDGGFRQVALDLHNQYRSQVNSSPLELNSELNKAAHEWAQKLASDGAFDASGHGYGDQENRWAHFGELRSLSLDTRDATTTWYTGIPFPENTIFSVNTDVLFSNKTKYLGVGVGTAEAYTVVLAYYL